MTGRLVALLLFFAITAAARADSALDQAYDEVRAAYANLQRAEEAQKAGEEPQEADRQGIVTPAGKRRRSRLTDDYWERQKSLEQDVEQAKLRLDQALKRWNQLK